MFSATRRGPGKRVIPVSSSVLGDQGLLHKQDDFLFLGLVERDVSDSPLRGWPNVITKVLMSERWRPGSQSGGGV